MNMFLAATWFDRQETHGICLQKKWQKKNYISITNMNLIFLLQPPDS